MTDVDRKVRYSKGERRLVALSWLLLLGGVFTCAGENLYMAVLTARIKETMSSMRTIATAWEAYANDHDRYNAQGPLVPVRGRGFTIPEYIDSQAGGSPRYPGVRFPYTYGNAELTALLVPKYIREIPKTDAWGFEWQFALDVPIQSPNASLNYAIRAACADGRFDDTVAFTERTWDRETWGTDIVFSNGLFISGY